MFPTNHRLIPAGLIVLVLLSVGYFSYFLRQFIHLPGTDAYYYALQTQSLVDSGCLKVPDGGVLYYVIAGVSKSGPSIETSFRLVLAAIYGLYNLGLLLTVLRLQAKVQPFAALLWTLGSPVIAFHTIEFPELSLGLATVPIWFWLLSSKFKSRWFWLSGLLLFCVFTHPALSVLGLLFIFSVALGRTDTPEIVARWTLIKRMILAIVVSAAVFVGATDRWPGIAPRLASLAPGPPALLGFVAAAGVPYDMKFAVLFFWVILILLLFDCLRTSPGRWKYLLPATLALALWPVHDAALFGLGGRLAGIFVFLALPLIIQVLDDAGENSRLFAWIHRPRTAPIVPFVLVGAIVILPVRLESYTGLLMSNDYAQYEKVVSVLSREDIPMLIAHRGLHFFYSYRLRRDAFHFDPEPNWNRADIWRVAVRITPEEVAYYSPPSCVWGETAKRIGDTDYLLVREDCWEALRARLNANDNPDLYAEVWEDMENPSQPRPAFLRARHRGLVERAFPAFTAGGE